MNEQALAGFEIVILAIGVICWVVALVRGRAQKWMSAPDQLTLWGISGSDFFLFVLLVITFFTVGPLGVAKLLEQDFTDLSRIDLLVQGYATQISMLAAWALFRIHPSGIPPAGTTDPVRAAITGAKSFIFLLPPLFAVIAAWYWLLEKSGFDPVPQDMVELIQDASGTELALWTVLAVGIAPVTEELVFRGAMFRFFAGRMPLIGAGFLSGLLFSLAHFNMLTFVPLLALGMVLAAVFMKTGRLSSSIALHAVFNLNSLVVILLSADAGNLS